MSGSHLHLRRNLSLSSIQRISFRTKPYPIFQGPAWIVRHVTNSTKMTRNSSDTSFTKDGSVATPATDIKYVESRGDYQQDKRTGYLVLVEDSKLPLYQHQASLPRLPVPCIEDSIQTLIPSALPLAKTNDEANRFLDASRKFAQQARKLQEQLEQRKMETKTDSSWLQQWWNQLGYMQVRDSVVINVSYFFRLDPFIALKKKGDAKLLPLSYNVLQQGALLLQNSALFAKQTREGSLEAEFVGRSNPTPLCSTQYKYLFASCRIPCPKEDVYRLYYYHNESTKINSIPRHAIVACRGHYYQIPVFTPQGKLVSTPTLERLLEDCRQNARNQSLNNHGFLSDLAFLTAMDRDTWTKAYECLQQTPRMAECLTILESGICVLAIDDYDHDDGGGGGDDDSDCKSTTRSASQVAQVLWHGNNTQTANRWWDKSINWVISKDYCGLVGEHALVDGMPSLNMCRFTLDRIYNNEKNDTAVDQNDSSSTDEEVGLSMTPIFQRAWCSLPASDQQKIECLVKTAKQQVTQQIEQYELQVLEFKGYGLQRIRASPGRPSADAWAQMAMQWASMRVFGTTVATYESTQTRRFLHGRTETTRSVSTASVAWVKSMVHGTDSLVRQRELFERALESHVQYSRQASEGQGIDRHFFGLSLCAAAADDNKRPDLLDDPLFLRSKRWRLSTSTLGGTSPGFGPVVSDGIGIGYDLIHNDLWLFTITARKEHDLVGPMKRELERCLQEMAIFLDNDKPPSSRL